MQKPKLVASDVDGTLLDTMERVSARTARAVARVVDADVPFVLVTGRPPRWIPVVAGAANLSGYAVCANGAVLYDIAADRVLSARTLDPVLLNDVASALDKVVPGITLAAERPAPAVPAGDVPPFVCEVVYSSPWGDSENVAAPRAEVVGLAAVKLLVRHRGMTSEELSLAAREVLGDAVDVTFSSSQGLIEISAPGVTKATGLAAVAELFGLSAADVVAFGDMPNDAPMLRWAGHGVAMANAHQEALDAADEVTAPNTEDGVAQVLERWF